MKTQLTAEDDGRRRPHYSKEGRIYRAFRWHFEAGLGIYSSKTVTTICTNSLHETTFAQTITAQALQTQ